MKYLRKFETEADVNMSVVPNVVLVGDTGKVIYNALNGVYIQHIDGNIYTTDEWTAGGFANDQANGVAVANGAVKVVIAKDVINDIKWSGNELIEGVMATTDSSIAMTDYAGEENTKLITSIYKDGAAYYCANYVFPNGKHGYLPAAGEIYMLIKYKSLVDSALSLIGGTTFGTNSYWSSTLYDESKAWKIYWPYGELRSEARIYSSYTEARPFTTL
jgi:hypothetical protein